MMKKSTIAAAAAAIALSGGAGAHEFVCEKTVDGEVIHVVDRYPATLHFKVVVTNTHPEDASVALALRDDLLASLGVDVRQRAPFTLAVGESTEFDAQVTVKSEAACRSLSRAQACMGSFEDAFQVIFDGGVAQCAVRLICMPEDAPGRERGR
jgi:hypothetical protein